MSATAYLLDSSIYIFKAWFSLPARWQSPAGYPLNAVYGYAGFLLNFLAQCRPVHLAAAFDESLGSCFRNDIYPAYKRSRELPDEALAFQLLSCRELTECLGIDCFSSPRYEADDYLATLARLFQQQDLDVALITRDKDLGQLLQRPGDMCWDFGTTNTMDRKGFFQRYGVTPAQFPQYQALVGDSVDDILGVPGIGAKTAARLLQAFGDLATLKAELGRLPELKLRGAARIRSALEQHWPALEVAQQLTELESQVPGVHQPAPFVLTAQALDAFTQKLVALNLEGPLTRRARSLARGINRE